MTTITAKGSGWPESNPTTFRPAITFRLHSPQSPYVGFRTFLTWRSPR